MISLRATRTHFSRARVMSCDKIIDKMKRRTTPPRLGWSVRYARFYIKQEGMLVFVLEINKLTFSFRRTMKLPRHRIVFPQNRTVLP